jgi:hypothetical protein
MKVLLDDKQLFSDRMRLAQGLFDLLHADRFAQVSVHHEHTTCAAGSAVSQQSGHHMMMWFQHGADGWYLSRFIGEIANEHVSGQTNEKSGRSNQVRNRNNRPR